MKNTQIALVSPFKSTYKKDKEKKADNNCKAFCISHKHRKQQQQQQQQQQNNKTTKKLIALWCLKFCSIYYLHFIETLLKSF